MDDTSRVEDLARLIGTTENARDMADMIERLCAELDATDRTGRSVVARLEGFGVIDDLTFDPSWTIGRSRISNYQ